MKRMNAGSTHQIDYVGLLSDSQGVGNPNPASADNVLVIGVLPPPVCGMSLVTQAVLDALKSNGNPKLVRLSPKNRMGRFFRVYKAFKVVVSVYTILRHALKPGMRLYMPADSGLGMYYNLLIVACARLLGFHVYLHHHSWAYISNKDVRMQLLTRLMGYKGTHVVLCEDMLREFSWRYSPVRSFIKVSNAAFFSDPATIRKRCGKWLAIGHLSNLSMEKGLGIVIETFRKLVAKKVPTKLILAGPAVSVIESRVIEKALHEFGDVMEYRGPVYGEDKRSFFMDIDVFLFPTIYENEAQPLVMLESLSNGIPFVSYARGCIPSDSGKDGGLCIPVEQDFIEHSLPILTEWAKDRRKLEVASIKAALQAKKLSMSAESELAVLIECLLQSN